MKRVYGERIMGNKDNENEGIGIFAIVIIIILAVIGLYYFFSYRPATAPVENANVPIEAPSPLHGNKDNIK